MHAALTRSTHAGPAYLPVARLFSSDDDQGIHPPDCPSRSHHSMHSSPLSRRLQAYPHAQAKAATRWWCASKMPMPAGDRWGARRPLRPRSTPCLLQRTPPTLTHSIESGHVSTNKSFPRPARTHILQLKRSHGVGHAKWAGGSTPKIRGGVDRVLKEGKRLDRPAPKAVPVRTPGNHEPLASNFT